MNDADILAWLENFHRSLVPRPSAFGVDERDVAALARHIQRFRSLILSPPDAARPKTPSPEKGGPEAAATEPAGPEPAGPEAAAPGGHAHTERALARSAAEQAAELLAQRIRLNPLTTPEDLALLGLAAAPFPPPFPGPSPASPPPQQS